MNRNGKYDTRFLEEYFKREENPIPPYNREQAARLILPKK